MKIPQNNVVDVMTEAETYMLKNNLVSNNELKGTNSIVNEMTDEKGRPTEQTYQTIVNKLNEFMEFSQRDSKFVFHKDLKKYYVELVDTKTKEVIKEIPPKKLLDAYYEMQKLIGKMFDKQV